jgi:ribosomal 30S subunit maturation factor RimM
VTGAAPDARAAADEPTSAVLGRLGRTYQLEGALRCYPSGEVEAGIVRSAQALVVEGPGLLRVRFARRHGAVLVIAFQGYRTPERAQALVNALVRLDPRDVASARALAANPLRPGQAVRLDGQPFGVLDEVVPGPSPLLRVRSTSGTHLVPAAAPYVRITADAVELVAPPAGLLDPSETA